MGRAKCACQTSAEEPHVLAVPRREQRVAAAAKRPFLGQNFHPRLEQDLQVAAQLQFVHDPRSSLFIHDQPARGAVDRRLQRPRGIFGREAPPGGACFLQLSRLHIRNRLFVARHVGRQQGTGQSEHRQMECNLPCVVKHKSTFLRCGHIFLRRALRTR